MSLARAVYSLVIAVYTDDIGNQVEDWRLGDITVDWVDFTREKSVDHSPEPLPPIMTTSNIRKKGTAVKNVPGSSSNPLTSTKKESPRKRHATGVPGAQDDPDALSLQPLVAHFPGPNPLDTSVASGITTVGRGVVHLFRHAPPSNLIASLDAHPVGESSKSIKDAGEWANEKAEGEDGSLIAILAVPAWMRPADFLEFIGGWATCLEGVRMIREATTPNRSIVLLKFRDPLQASDFLVIFTGRPFSTLDARETCHPIHIHHLVLHHAENPTASDPTIAVPAFPPSVYSSRPRDLLHGVDQESTFELPSCPVCLERLDSTITGLVTLPCAHTFDCDCLRKWGDSRCPVCRVSHLLLASPAYQASSSHELEELTRLTKCATCGATSNNWICVVCGVVGCGRYDPGKGHARRHWEESGHVLAMELETQRVWDYKGDNYVHRLIQTRTDGKLVELPSASSLVTSTVSRPMPLASHNTPDRRNHLSHHSTPDHTGPRDSSKHSRTASLQESDEAGPSSGDVEKMSSIESITLEYSYLLSSQLEAMRQHYEAIADSQARRLDSLETVEARANAAEAAKVEADKARIKAEKKAEKASELTRMLQQNLSAEKAMSEGLSTRVTKLKEEVDRIQTERRAKADEIERLEEMVKDLMFTVEAGVKIQAAGGADSGEGGQLVVVPGKNGKEKKKGKI